MNSAELIKRIKNRLGYPTIDIEVSDEQIQLCIDDALLTVRDYISTKYLITLPLLTSESPLNSSYTSYVDLDDVDDLDEVTDVYIADSVSSPYIYDEFNLVNYAKRGLPANYAIAINLRSNMEAMLNRSWKRVGNRLYVHKYYTAVTIEYTKKTVDIGDIEDSFYINWVTRYSLACVKEVLGRVRGKFVVDSNPFKTDHDTLLQEAATEKTELEEELANHNIPGVTR